MTLQPEPVKEEKQIAGSEDLQGESFALAGLGFERSAPPRRPASRFGDRGRCQEFYQTPKCRGRSREDPVGTSPGSRPCAHAAQAGFGGRRCCGRLRSAHEPPSGPASFAGAWEPPASPPDTRSPASARGSGVGVRRPGVLGQAGGPGAAQPPPGRPAAPPPRAHAPHLGEAGRAGAQRGGRGGWRLCPAPQELGCSRPRRAELSPVPSPPPPPRLPQVAGKRPRRAPEQPRRDRRRRRQREQQLPGGAAAAPAPAAPRSEVRSPPALRAEPAPGNGPVPLSMAFPLGPTCRGGRPAAARRGGGVCGSREPLEFRVGPGSRRSAGTPRGLPGSDP